MKFKITYLTAFIALSCLFQLNLIKAAEPTNYDAAIQVKTYLNKALATNDNAAIRAAVANVINKVTNPTVKTQMTSLLNQALTQAGISADPSNPFAPANAVAAVVEPNALAASRMVHIPATVDNAINPALIEFEKFFAKLSPADRQFVVDGGNLNGATEDAFLRAFLAKKAAAEAQLRPGFVPGVVNPQQPVPVPQPGVINDGRATLEPRLNAILEKFTTKQSIIDLNTKKAPSSLWIELIAKRTKDSKGNVGDQKRNEKIFNFIDLFFETPAGRTSIKKFDNTMDNIISTNELGINPVLNTIIALIGDANKSINNKSYDEEMVNLERLSKTTADDLALQDIKRRIEETPLGKLKKDITRIITFKQCPLPEILTVTIPGPTGNLDSQILIIRSKITHNQLLLETFIKSNYQLGERNLSKEVLHLLQGCRSIITEHETLKKSLTTELSIKNAAIVEANKSEVINLIQAQIENGNIQIDEYYRQNTNQYDDENALAKAWKTGFSTNKSIFVDQSPQIEEAVASLNKNLEIYTQELDSKKDATMRASDNFINNLSTAITIVEMETEKPLCTDTENPSKKIPCEVENPAHVLEYEKIIKEKILQTNSLAQTLSQINNKFESYINIIGIYNAHNKITKENLEHYNLTKKRNISASAELFATIYQLQAKKIAVNTGFSNTKFTTITTPDKALSSKKRVNIFSYDAISYYKKPEAKLLTAGIEIEPTKKGLAAKAEKLVLNNNGTVNLSLFAPTVANPNKDIFIIPNPNKDLDPYFLIDSSPLYKASVDRVHPDLGGNEVLRDYLMYLMARLEMPNYEDPIKETTDAKKLAEIQKQIKAKQNEYLQDGRMDPKDRPDHEKNALYTLGEIDLKAFEVQSSTGKKQPQPSENLIDDLIFLATGGKKK